MALLWMDSFDHYVSADLTDKYAVAVGSTIQIAGGRRSTNSYRVGNSTSNRMIAAVTPGSTTVIFGVALKISGMPASASTELSIIVMDVPTLTDQVGLNISTAGFLRVIRGSTVLATATIGAISAASYAYIEAKIVIHPSAGSAVVRVNELEVINVSSINTAASGVATWSGVMLRATNFINNQDFDDFYICDSNGSSPWNNFLGDVRVDPRYPTAEGASSAWTPLSGTDNALMVDDPGPSTYVVTSVGPDDDTTYNSAASVLTDTFVVQDAPVVGATIYGVQTCIGVKKSDAGACSIAPVVRPVSTDFVGTAQNPGTSYTYLTTMYQANPATSAQWTEAGFNATEFGYKRIT